MFFSKEENVNDVVFSTPRTTYESRSTISDYRYDKELMRTYAFNTTNTTIYGIVDGIPLTIPYDNNFSRLRDAMGDIDIYEPGVFIIKTYSYTHISDLSNLIEYWHGSTMNMLEDTVNKIKEFIVNFTSKSNIGERVKFRLVEFIAYSDLLTSDRFSKIYGGTISISIKKKYDYTFSDNRINISLPGDGSIKWLVLGEKVLPLQTSKRIGKCVIELQHCSSKVERIEAPKLTDLNIYDTREEACNNTISNSLKRDEHLLKVDKIRYEERKLVTEAIQLEEKNGLTKFSNELTYKTEIIKLMIAEKNLLLKEMDSNKAMLESGMKVLGIVESMFSKFKGKK